MWPHSRTRRGRGPGLAAGPALALTLTALLALAPPAPAEEPVRMGPARSLSRDDLDEAAVTLFYADPQVTELESRIAGAEAELVHIQRLTRHGPDPAVAHTRRQISELKAKKDALWEELRPRLLLRVAARVADDDPKAKDGGQKDEGRGDSSRKDEGRPSAAPEKDRTRPAATLYVDPNPRPARPITAAMLKEPRPFRVYQRDRDGRAEIPVALDEEQGVEDARLVTATISNVLPGGPPRFRDGKLVGLPTGGPYNVRVGIQVGNIIQYVDVPNVYVGDLWVLAGQSNMEGYGDLVDPTPPDDRVMLLGMDGKWSRAEEPLHWLVDSPDPVHSGNPDDRARRSAEAHKTRAKGAGLGLPFASAMVQATGVPVGLIAAAHGGTSMEQWSPEKKGEGGKSLYGSMLRQVTLAGGKVRGVLWYQGESDAMKPEAAKAYEKTFADFIAAVRDDLNDPELPFYFVQIGRFVHDGSPADWNAVQDAQRRLAERVPNTAVVASVDLELDDLIHVGTQGQKRLGLRLARVALRELFGQAGGTTPTLDRVNKGSRNTLVVKFKGVNLARESESIPPLGGMRGPGGQGMMAVPVSGPGFRQIGVRGRMGSPVVSQGPAQQDAFVGLRPGRHIAGFSVRQEDGTEIPLIYDAAVGSARDTVILKLIRPVPEKAFLWYGYGFDPYCNLTDALDMAVPVFGPVPLDEVR